MRLLGGEILLGGEGEINGREERMRLLGGEILLGGEGEINGRGG